MNKRARLRQRLFVLTPSSRACLTRKMISTLPKIDRKSAYTFRRAVFLLLLWAGGWMPPFVHSEAPDVAVRGLPTKAGEDSLNAYDVRIEGLSSQDLLHQLTQISNSVALKDKPPGSLSLLRKRADEDIALFIQWLRAQGFFGARIEAIIDEAAKPLTIIFKVDTGSAFLLRSPEVEVLGGIESEIPELGLKAGHPFSASSLALAQDNLVRRFTTRGFPFAKIADRRIVVDHADQSVAVTLFLGPGSEARFGSTRISGLVEVDEDVVRRTLPWKEGEVFNAELLEAAQKKLASLGLFSLIRVLPAQDLDEDGRLPVSVILTERRHRSVEAGLSY